MKLFTHIGTLPRGGEWKFCLVTIEGQGGVLVVVDMSGKNSPRMIVDGKLVEILPS